MENTLEKIYKASIKLLAPLTPEETYSTIVDEALKLVGAEYGSILLEQDGELKRVYGSKPIAYKTYNRKRGNTYRAFTQRRTIIAPISEIGKWHPQLKSFGVKWTIFIPLSYRGKAIGVLTINTTKENKFSRKELGMLHLFGSMASLAVRKTQLYNETKRALETRDVFIAMAAHEFRTPVTTINGYVQLLHSKLKGSTSAESRWVEELSWEVSRLTGLINELLEVNRIRSGILNYTWRECNLEEVMQRAVVDFKFNHPHYQIVFQNKTSDSTNIVVGDFDKLLQVIINILDNAAKFSSTDKEIVVTLQRKGSYAVLEVKDRGVGIERDDLLKVFEGYYKKGDHQEGMGIGLFLVKNIIKEHHGMIKINSKVNKGTTIEVKLPRVKI